MRQEIREKTAGTVEDLKNAVRKKAETANDSAEQAAGDVRDVVGGVPAATENVGRELQEGSKEVKKDLHKTAANISKELHASGK